MDSLKTSKLFFIVGLVNGFVALAATSLILFPDLRLAAGPGSILTHNVDVWPGGWGWVSYYILLIVGVCGAFIWSLSYFLLKSLFGVEKTPTALSAGSLVLYEVGVLMTVALTAYVGLEGGRFVADGGSPIVVTALIGWAVIPTGAGVGLALLGTLLGLVNLVLAVARRR
ncbi:MAG: hypothetical protein NZ570_04810 [Candidatus Caldarchaeum sp.]|nr:hypothetical protein [Candidatus Caldarchaeum sp.]MDW8360356.1 hypothetical protein [Candidatus Caldarchaeum sp.]